MREKTAWGFQIWIILLLTIPMSSGREHNVSWGDFASQAFDMEALSALENKYRSLLVKVSKRATINTMIKNVA